MIARAISDMAKLFAPPVLARGYRALRGKGAPEPVRLTGDYASWSAAEADSTGYDSERILAKTKDALLKVKRGEAVHERDSVLFDEIQYSWPLLAGLMWAAARSGGHLNVLDFGGSLGSTYFQNREFLGRLPSVRWNVVEQAAHVEIGKAEFEDDSLRFFDGIGSCLADTQPNVAVLSGVLQYLERPFDTLRALLSSPCNHMIVDRTPFWDGPEDKLCLQRVPPTIYDASYPSWIFSKRRFRSVLGEGWSIVAEFEGCETLPSPVEAVWEGLIAC